MRHGQKALDGSDNLTGLGAKQVSAAAAKYFSKIRFDGAFYSGMDRARMTLMLALERSLERPYGKGSLDPIIELEEGFGYEWAQKDPYVSCSATAVAELEKELGTEATALEWFDRYPHAQYYRGRMIGALYNVATRTFIRKYITGMQGDGEAIFGRAAAQAEQDYDFRLDSGERPMPDDISILVATHSPVCEFAAPRLDKIPRLNVADILRYTLGLEWVGKTGSPTWQIIDAKHFPCPSAEEVEATILP